MNGHTAAMTEPDVTLTDYALTIECALFALLLYLHGDRNSPSRPWFMLFFASIGIATLTGGTVHGFFLDTESIGYRILWPVTLVAGGVAALATWGIAAKLGVSEKTERRIIRLATLAAIFYCATVLFLSQEFYITVINYLFPTLFLLIVLHKLYRHMRIRELGIGAIGLVLTFVAAGAQQGRLGLHPLYFNHNAVYHTIQAVALLMIFWAARWLVKKKGPGVF
jgi:hypothetical protein